MNRFTRDFRSAPGGRLALSSRLILAILGLIAAPSADAGPIRPRHHAVHARALVRAERADPWGAYWQAALRQHRMQVQGPRALSILSVSPERTIPDSPFVEYLQWRRGRNVRQFDLVHPAIARMFRTVEIARLLPFSPSASPSSSATVTAAGDLNPPQVPEPASGLIALLLIVSAAAARRWARPHAPPVC